MDWNVYYAGLAGAGGNGDEGKTERRNGGGDEERRGGEGQKRSSGRRQTGLVLTTVAQNGSGKIDLSALSQFRTTQHSQSW